MFGFLAQRFAPRFQFLDPGELRDGDLRLVQPKMADADDFLRSAKHPGSAGSEDGDVTPAGLRAFLRANRKGQEPPSLMTGRTAAYRFWMRLDDPAPVPIGGTVSLRVGEQEDLRLYFGHVGYAVFPPARGRRLAERSVRLILPLARRHGMHELWITTNPDNAPSRRTCERLGAHYVETIDVPRRHPLYARGERQKCRYLLVP